MSEKFKYWKFTLYKDILFNAEKWTGWVSLDAPLGLGLKDGGVLNWY